MSKCSFDKNPKQKENFPTIIPQQRLFGWEEIEGLFDLKRLRLVLENIRDEKLMRRLERKRG